MTIVHYQDCVSPHQMPLARALCRRCGVGNFRYVYRDADQAGRSGMGWDMQAKDDWCLHVGGNGEEARRLIESADVLLTGMRELDLFERRSEKGLITFYQTERWFKPIYLSVLPFPISGFVRLLLPRYLMNLLRLRRLVMRCPNFHLLPIGVHARRDFVCVGIPANKQTLWGYFVAPSPSPPAQSPRCRPPTAPLRMLYVGRLIALKRVDTIIEALRKAGAGISLTIVGGGLERVRLETMAKGLPVVFQPSIPIAEVRSVMREHDVLVFSSNGRDGWGAVVSEALEEGLVVFGTHETGASATMLPCERLFHAGNADELAVLLKRAVRGEFAPTGIGEWSVEKAADRLLHWIGGGA